MFGSEKKWSQKNVLHSKVKNFTALVTTQNNLKCISLDSYFLTGQCEISYADEFVDIWKNTMFELPYSFNVLLFFNIKCLLSKYKYFNRSAILGK